MVKGLWITLCLDGEKPRSYGNPEGTDRKGGLTSPEEEEGWRWQGGECVSPPS